MTNEELIAKIKAEIERQRKFIEGMFIEGDNNFYDGQDDAYNNILTFLSTLESEKPMQEGLEEEIDRLWESFADEMEGPHNLFDIYARLARHFAQWGSEHLADARKTSPNDLEEASSKFATLTTSDGVSVEFLYEKLSFQEGAKWQKEQMMKEAVEAELYLDGDFLAIDLDMTQLGYSEKDKVRIIIVKEDGK